MNESFTIYSLLLLFGCLVLGAFFSYILYSKTSALKKPLRIILASIRAILITFIAWLIFAPLIYRLSYTLEKPVVIIAQDNSQSIRNIMPSGFDSLRYKKEMQKLNSVLSGRYEVRTVSFSDRTNEGLIFDYQGNATNAAVLASKLKDEFLNRNVGAVIIASDGIFNKGGNPIQDLQALKAPVFTIALGDTVPKKDLLIADASANELVYLDNDFTLEVQVQAYQSKGNQSKLQVLEDGVKIQEQPIVITDILFNKTISIVLKATRLGKHKYTIQLSALDSELSLKNNSQDVLVDVIDDRQKILIAAEGPHPDIGALKQSISANRHYAVSVVMSDALNQVDPRAYGLIILYQYPGLQSTSSAFLRKLSALQLPIWYIMGAQSDISGFNSLQNLAQFSGSTSKLINASSNINTTTSAFSIDSVSKKAIQSFDPLQSYFGDVTVKDKVETILYQQIGQVKTKDPQLFLANNNGKKSGYLFGEGIWKWKLSESEENTETPVFNGLLNKVIQYLTVKDNNSKFKTYQTKNSFTEGENIKFNATLYDDSYKLVNSPDVNLAVKNDKNKVFNFTFSKTESSYELDAGMLPAGDYSYKATVNLGGKGHTATGSFIITAQLAEFQQTIANHQLLHQLATSTQGKMFHWDQIKILEKTLTQDGAMKTLSYEDRKYEELINFKILFFLIILLLSTEWFLRKRNALIA